MVTTKPFNTVRRKPALMLLPALAVAAVVAGCGSSGSSKTTASVSSAAAATPAQSAPAATENVSMQVLTSKMAAKKGYLGPDRNGHDTFMLSNLSSGEAHEAQTRSNLKVKTGDTISVTVTNYDEGPHTFTSPELGVSATIAPATNATKGIPSKTTFTFTAKKSGKFRWFCLSPCDAKHGGWAMTPEGAETDRVGYMAGYVVAS
jgi:heme/copper-type cytochrome/quinol oxidase subunit 2